MAGSIDTEADEVQGSEKNASPKSRRILVVVVALLCLVVGGAVGMVSLGPAVAPILADRVASADTAVARNPVALHLIDNLVVNPARSRGTRFLLVSVAVEVIDAGSVPAVALHDVELRAALLVVLGSRTVDELTDIEERAAIVQEVRDAIVGVVGPSVVRKIFIPQFVIQ